MTIKKLVHETTRESLRSKDTRGFIGRILREELAKIMEDTTLVSLVAKTQDPAVAEKAVSILKQKNINARTTSPAKFDPFSKQEQEGHGVYVEPDAVTTAADVLGPSIEGLEFDPYVRLSGK